MEYKLENTILYLDKVNIGYGNKIILKDISLEEKNITRTDKITGQCIAILGRSGRGKSTLFKALAGLIKPISGQILVSDDYNANSCKIISEGDAGFVDQAYTLFRHKTVYECLKFALRKQKLSNAEKHTMIVDALNEWKLLSQKDQYPNELSGGQRQRTAILEQLFTSKKYIVFDEPASGLDVGNIEKLKESFEHISQTNDLNTVIFSTHDINLAVNLADSIYILGHENPEDQVSTIISHYDLKAMGLAWEHFGEKHLELSKKIREDILRS